MNRKFSLGVCISLIAVACAVTFVLTMNLSLSLYNERITGVGQREAIYTKLQDIDSYVRSNTLGSIDEEKLTAGIMNGYMSGLGDSKAGYITAEEYQELSQNIKGKIITTGVRVARDESGYIIIEEVYEGSSATLHGIEVGDLITHIDGALVLEIGAEEAIRRLSGEEGQRVSLMIRSAGVDRRVTLTRQEIELITVKGINHNEIGYIRISGISDNTGAQFDAILNDLISNGAKALIIDVRGLNGSTVTPLKQILDKLLPIGVAAVGEYRNGSLNNIIEITNDAHTNVPLTVIVDINTAEGGELLAAVLKDFAGATLVGMPTKGDAVLTTTQTLKDGSAVVLSNIRVRSNGGTSFDGEGLRPDYTQELVITEIETDLYNLGDTQDAQIRKAFEVTETRIEQ